MQRPRLVLTSPPYPGVHVLYHRWQVQGRRETAAPFWIANSLDGAGAAYYTLGDRKDHDLKKYFEEAEKCFRSVAQICDQRTLVVQMVAFPEPAQHLPRYLEMLASAGLKEVCVTHMGKVSSSNPQDRLWRRVPNRKWYASQRGSIGASKEVVLFHRIAS